MIGLRARPGAYKYSSSKKCRASTDTFGIQHKKKLSSISEVTPIVLGERIRISDNAALAVCCRVPSKTVTKSSMATTFLITRYCTRPLKIFCDVSRMNNQVSIMPEPYLANPFERPQVLLCCAEVKERQQRIPLSLRQVTLYISICFCHNL